jgi:hypothetical protein
MLRSSQHFCRQNILLNKYISTKLYGGTSPQKYFIFQNLKIQKFLGPIWGAQVPRELPCG